LSELGFTVSERPFVLQELGIEWDAEATTADGRTFLCEFKGSWVGRRPGMARTDTVKKALADALLCWADDAEYPPILLITSHHPAPDSRGARMVAMAISCGAVLDVFSINDQRDVERLRRLAKESS
jgi:hypothetical protein